LYIKTPRLECRKFKRVLNAVLPHGVPKSHHTKSFARIVVDLRKMMTIRDVSRYLGVSEGMVRNIDKAFCKRRLENLVCETLRSSPSMKFTRAGGTNFSRL